MYGGRYYSFRAELGEGGEGRNDGGVRCGRRHTGTNAGRTVGGEERRMGREEWDPISVDLQDEAALRVHIGTGKGRRPHRARRWARPRNGRRARAVVRWRLNRAASMLGSRVGCNVRGSLRIAKGARYVEQWHHALRLGRRRRCGVSVQVAAYAEGTEKSAERRSSRGRRRLSGSANQTFLEGDEARDLLRLGHACVPENNERRGSGRMGQPAAEMVGAVIRFAAGDAGYMGLETS
ncbi:hypothetical protein B0H14DRAFT_2564581 [Mycena olivaceomarginata]|nr:hypothetical protein B0H14DRAFT_2564581 [Mycena olivaceomarginata]